MPAADQSLLLRAFCDELARCGMTEAVTSPGSRNTPLLLALVREPRLRATSHIDERSAGFFALGAAKASGRPVVLTCTSGTAAANLAPAVIEAFHARVPLVVLTADRPPELREVGAGQTIDQTKLYGDAVRWFAELDLSSADPARVRWIRALACRAYWTAQGTPAGPVHINVPLREPLIPDGSLPGDPVPGRPGGRPWTSRGITSPSRAGGEPFRIEADRPVIVAGGGEPGGEALSALAERAGIPLLADPLSGARRGPAAVAHYDLILRSESFTAAHPPDLVVRTGELPTSKPLRRWLAGLDAEQVAVDPGGGWQDPDAVVGRRVGGLDASAAPPHDADWLAGWRAADAAVARALEDVLASAGLSEPLVAARLCRWLPADALLYVAASMPIRDVEEFAAARAPGPRVLANRGANGIDGTVSSAFGAAAVHPGRVVLLIGDVALAHDIGGLLSGRRLGLELTIVLLNNDGGGIFHFLPVAGEPDAFETHVATPHGLDFAHAAALYGARYHRVADERELRDALTGADATTIVEVRTDRAENLALHRRVAGAAAAALGAG